MKKIEQLNKAKSLLSQAILSVINSFPNDQSVKDAKYHIQKAISNLDSASEQYNQKKVKSETISQNWWNNVVSGMITQSQTKHTKESYNRSLKQLNSMIQKEENYIKELENKSNDTEEEDLLNE